MNVPSTPFEIETALDDHAGRLSLSGELDLSTVGQVQEAVEELLSGGVRRLVVDLRALRFVDSSGLRLFIVLDQRAVSEGWTLGLVRPGEPAMTVFRVSGAEGNLPFIEASAD